MELEDITFESFTWSRGKGINDDTVLTGVEQDIAYFGIADGVGGSPGGSLASKLAVLEAEEAIKNLKILDVEQVYRRVQTRISKAAQKTPNLREMATTLTSCIIKDGKVFIGHVGDTRLYLIRNNQIVYRTSDQTLLEDLTRKGVVTPPVKAKRYDNVLSSALSATDDYKLETATFNLEEADIIIICSDGVHKICSDKEMLQLFQKSTHVSQFVLKVKALLRIRGIVDDSSLIAIQYK